MGVVYKFRNLLEVCSNPRKLKTRFASAGLGFASRERRDSRDYLGVRAMECDSVIVTSEVRDDASRDVVEGSPE